MKDTKRSTDLRQKLMGTLGTLGMRPQSAAQRTGAIRGSGDGTKGYSGSGQ